MINKIVLALALFLSWSKVDAQTFNLFSPSGKISIAVTNSESLFYQVKMGEKTIISRSPLGFDFKNEPFMGQHLTLLSKKETERDSNWRPVIRSKHELVRDHYKQLVLQFIEKDSLKRRLDIEVRAYDDGIAFRYQLYRSEVIGNRLLTKERTQFNMEGDPKAWVVDYRGYATSREAPFIPMPLSRVPDSIRVGLPLLIEVDKEHFAAITEAKIDNYPGFFVGVEKDGEGKSVNLLTKLSPLPLETENGVKARLSDKSYTPWRVVMLGTTPGSLLESEIIQNLNDPCALNDVSWIKPGISAWDHWWSGEVKMDMPTIKQYIDLANTQGWPYMLMDWQWYGPFDTPGANILRAAPQLDMEELLAYAKAKKVRLWVWLTNGDANRNNNFEEAFALYEKWGIAGVKIDFMNRDDQEMVNWYRDIIKNAASHHLMLDFHGAYKPDGIIRTFPNMMTREGVMGNEYNKWSNDETAEHNVTIPFTRMLAGQMDYTPGGFINVTKAKHRPAVPTQVMNSRCAELAKFVVYESPFTVACEHPDHLIGQPGAEFLTVVPTVWDDTKVLSGYPGEHIIVAKRRGKKYFMGAMTNNEARKITVKLDFLPPGKYRLVTWEDAADASSNPTHLVKRILTVSNKDTYAIEMAEAGGFVAELTSIKGN